jgi:hypothetical protein
VGEEVNPFEDISNAFSRGKCSAESNTRFFVSRFVDPARRMRGTDLPKLLSATDAEGKMKPLTVVPGNEPVTYDTFESLDR